MLRPALRTATLDGRPLAFRAWTGLTPAGFDALLAAVSAADAAEREERRGRQPAPGAGHPHALPLAERLLLALVYLRHRPIPIALAVWFGVGETTTWRSRKVVERLLRAVGREDLFVRTPDEVRRREVAEALGEMPEMGAMSEWFRWGDHWDWKMPAGYDGLDYLGLRFANLGLAYRDGRWVKAADAGGGTAVPDAQSPLAESSRRDGSA